MNILSLGLPGTSRLNPNVAGGFTGVNYVAWLVGYFLFDEKMITIFSMLFVERCPAVGRTAEPFVHTRSRFHSRPRQAGTRTAPHHRVRSRRRRSRRPRRRPSCRNGQLVIHHQHRRRWSSLLVGRYGRLPRPTRRRTWFSVIAERHRVCTLSRLLTDHFINRQAECRSNPVLRTPRVYRV